MPISHPFLVTDTYQGVIMRLSQETRMLDGIPAIQQCTAFQWRG